MKTRIIPMITMRWLAVILVVALVPWLAIAAGREHLRRRSSIRLASTRNSWKPAQLGDLARVKRLLGKGADLMGEDRIPPLIAAASGGHLEMVRSLLDKGAEAKANSRFDGTALMRAASGGHLRVMKLLLDKGADVTASDSNSRTALTIARQRDCKPIGALLKAHGAKE